ncbi:MAG: insulinase family protein, partial [Acidobacteriota bacterium]|nr:insulinase family protein [Acidobacteriota bacterium]
AGSDPVPYKSEMKAGVFFIEKSDVTQANIQVGHLGMLVADDPDYFSIQVMNEILGGSFASRLFQYVRTDKGLAYGVGGSVGASYRYPGIARFSLQTKSETMGEAVDALFHVLRGMHTDPVTEDEISRAKDSILNSFIFNYASTGQILGQQMLYTYYGLPLDFLDSFRSKVESVTREDIARVAKKYLHPDQMTLLVVGKAEAFDRPMDTFGEVQVVDITIPSPEIQLAAVEATEEGAAAGRELFATVVAALGGSNEPAEALKTVEETVVNMQGQTMAISQESLIVYPDRVYAAVSTPMGEQVMVVDGDEGFMAMGGQSRPVPAEQIERQLKNFAHDLQYVLRYSDAEDLEAVSAGEEEVAGTHCSILALTFNGEASRWWVDGEGRVLKAAYQSNHPFTQAPGLFEVLFSDYREVEGRLVPHKQVTSVDGTQLLETTLKTFEVNPAVDATLFEKPAA